jgi:acetyl esterase/lipase
MKRASAKNSRPASPASMDETRGETPAIRAGLSSMRTGFIAMQAAIPYLLAVMNGVCMLLSVIWLTAAGKGIEPQSVFWNLFGGLLMLTVALNPLLAGASESARKWDEAFLGFNLFVIMAVPMLVTGASAYVPFVSSRSLPAGILVLALLLAGMFRAFFFGRNKSYRGGHAKVPQPMISRDEQFSRRKVFKFIRLAILGGVLFFGLFVAYSLLATDKEGILEVMVPEFGYFWAVLFLTSACLFVRINRFAKFQIMNRVILVIGFALFLVCLLPLLSTPFLLKSAETEIHAAFGDSFDEVASESSFRTMPFSLPEAVFGMGNGACTVTQDIAYLREKRSDGKETILRFDAYQPKDILKPDDGYPVLIRIHGGAWTIGDKGSGNFAQENKYFAGKGYCVFDVQYGLADKEKFIAGVPVSDDVVGPFDIDDMVRQLGVFTRYLADRREQLKIDSSRVFISGGSAGGQLACAVGLGLADGRYAGILDNRIRIRGILPYYPAIGLSTELGIGGSPQWVDPVMLVSGKSPPCLVYQGTHDGIVDPSTPLRLRDAYQKAGNPACAILYMPFGSHGSDLSFSANYHQVYLYYMERFMAHFSE